MYYYAYPSIAVNRNRDVLIGYNRFSSNDFAGSFVAFRRASDPPGGLVFDVPLKAGEDSYDKGILSNLWGTYSSTVVDPADDMGFWTLQQFAASKSDAGTSLWGTYWGKLQTRSGTCTTRIDRTTAEIPSSGGTVELTVTPTFGDCTFITEPNASWIRKHSSRRDGSGLTFQFQVSPNRFGNARTATISLGTELFTLRQAANAAPPAPEPNLTVTSFEAPTAARVRDSISLFATIRNIGTRGAGRFRTGFYYSDKLPVTNQDNFTGVGCQEAQGLLADELVRCSGTFQLEANLSPGTYYFAAIADDRQEVAMTDRSAATRLADAGPLVLQPEANAPAISSAGIVHGATAAAGPLSPGQILVIYGERLGPAALTTIQLDTQGRVSPVLAGTRIFFDDVPGPLIYTSASQLSVIVPYAVAGKTSTRIVAEYNGVKGAAATLPVAPASPGLFSVDFSGRNQVAALNQDSSVNSVGNPAERGSLVVLYGSGAGSFRTIPVDGAVIGLPLPELLVPLTVQIAGQSAEVVYAGPAPALVSGVFQINARVPAGIEAGSAVPVLVSSGTFTSPAGTTIAVK